MPDSKITALTSISTSTDPANDPLVIVDVSDTSMAATGTTKKVTLNQLLGASGTATLASATISGDLTVDTSTLKVDSANNRVGVGTATPAVNLEIGDGTGTRTLKISGATNIFDIGFGSLRGGSTYGDVRLWTDRFRIYNAAGTQIIKNIDGTNGDETWYDGAGGTRMTLNSTGLGVGVTPSAWGSNWKANHVGTVGSFASSGAGSAPPTAMVIGAYNDNTNWKYQFSSTGAARYEMTGANAGSAHAWYISPGGTAGNNITFTQAMTLDASGNLLVGKSVSLFSTVGVEASGTGFISATNSASTNASTNLSVYSTGAAAFRFYVGLGGTVFATNTTISAISDARLKENVQDLDVGLGAILALKPRKFDWKAGKGKDIKGDRGFIAQEFEQVFPQLVDEWKDEAPEGEAPYKSVRQDLIPVLVKAIQELTARVQTLETR